ncbi:MAG: hypothetical protein EBR86_13540 [Planctomycetia bacterium]|nr:hypothetical protein [Planctomycetia bacterium]
MHHARSIALVGALTIPWPCLARATPPGFTLVAPHPAHDSLRGGLRTAAPPDDPLWTDRATDAPRLTISGLLGLSPGTPGTPGTLPAAAAAESPLLAGTIFSGDGAVGIDFPRPWGAVRVECEARGPGVVGAAARPGAVGRGAGAVLANVWHDLDLTERVAVYAGGGVGLGTSPASAGHQRSGGFAWQTGTGITYDLTERMTLDIGYRFGGQEPLTPAAATLPATGTMVLAVRINDPFQGWRERQRTPRTVAVALPPVVPPSP